MFVRKLLACFIWMVFVVAADAQKLTIAAASDLGPAFKEITAGFEKDSGLKVDVILGSSGSFFAQIQNGAPYDLFFSADRRYAQKLQDAGVAQDLTLYAEGRIVLWVRNDSALNLSRGLNILADSSVKRIAIANPDHAPYGRAAVSALKHAGLVDGVRAKFVIGENISQATQFAQTGNADAAITALSLALSPVLKAEGRYWEVPQTLYPRMEQAAVLLTSSKQQDPARRFLAYLKTAPAQEIMRRYGFRQPEQDK